MTKMLKSLATGAKGRPVAALHIALEALGVPVAPKEAEALVFGETTASALRKVQSSLGLPTTGKVDQRGIAALRAHLKKRGLLDAVDARVKELGEEPEPIAGKGFVVTGRVTDASGRPVETDVVIQRLKFRGESRVGSAKSDKTGFYEATLDVDTDEDAVSLVAVAKINRKELRSDPVYNAKQHTTIDLTTADRVVAARSGLDLVRDAVAPVIGNVRLGALKETETQNDISFLAAEREVDPEELARAALSDRVAGASKLPTEVVYAFVAQNAVQGLPAVLSAPVAAPEQADEMDERVLSGILSFSPERQRKILTNAANADQIPLATLDRLDETIKTLEAMKRDVMGRTRFGAGKATLDEILGETTLTRAQKDQFIALQIQAQKGEKRLWDLVDEADGIPAARKRDLRYTLTLGSISKNHLPFMDFAKKKLPRGNATSPGRLAMLSVGQWEELVTDGVKNDPTILPENIDGETVKDRIGAFAQMLAERAEQNFPAAATVARIVDHPKAELESSRALMAMVQKLPDINLRNLNIAAVRLGTGLPADDVIDPQLKASVEAIQGLSETAVTDLKVMQRAMRLTPGADAAAALVATGTTAAHSIHAMGRDNFTRMVKDAGMTDLQAEQAFGRASASYGYLMARFLEYRLDLDKASPQALGGAWKLTDLKAEVDNDPSLRTLFGSLDSCFCEWCESVHGPAAYYTDVLRWLGQRDAKAGSGFSSARAVLADRRPDLLDILLNCDNTDTLMPYIDLVNETLEEAIAPTGNARNTTLRSELLMAEPEYVNDAAYVELATARHAPGLPFDLPHVEAATYLAHLQTPRQEIMKVFGTADAAAQAASHFGLSQTQAQIITTPALGDQDAFWAMTAAGELVPTAPVQTLLARADISYENLANLLATRFINGTEPLSSFQPEFECDLIERTVINLSNDRLDRMNRFIRFWRQTDWQIWELDLALTALGGVLDGAALVGLMRIDRMAKSLRLRVEEAVAMVAPLDTRVRDWLTGDGRALYPDLFQNLAVLNPPDPDLAITAVTDPNPPATLGDKADLIAASLGLARADLDLLIPAVEDPDLALPLATDDAALAALSQVFRFARLTKALSLRVGDFLTYCRMAGAPVDGAGKVDPFQSGETLEVFLEAFARHATSGLTITETRHMATRWDETPLGMSEADLGANLAAFRTALAELQAETIVAPEDRAAALDRQLPRIPGFEDPDLRATAISIVDDSFAGTVAERDTFITDNFGVLMPVASAIAAFAPFAGPPAGLDAAIDARRLTMLEAIYAVLARTTITVTLAGITGLEDAAAEYLAWQVTHPFTEELGPQLLDPAFLELNAAGDGYLRDTTRADMADLFATLALVDKIATAADLLEWSTARLIWFVENGGSFGLPRLEQLPLLGNADAMPFEEWITLLRWSAVMDRYPDTETLSLPIILTLLGTPGYDAAQLTTDLAVWMQKEEATMAGAIAALGLTFPGDFGDIDRMEGLLAALDILSRTGVPAAQVAGWGGAGVAAAQAQEIKLAVKARHDLDDWLEIAVPLQDRLREAKRIALVTFLTSRPGSNRFADTDALFAHLLIDPEMSACRTTSRLVQATGSVQLFVQRCLMNLEEDVLADAEADDDWNHWEWMSAYRIWEASRKVFLWPENVIRPELNMHKSPQMLELEQKLSQGEITAENTEVALENYLNTLDGIANLDIVAMHEQNTPKGRVIRVLARTKADPPEYYYREQTLPKGAVAGSWSPWDRVELDIKGEPFFGFVNRKVYIFWLSFMAKPDPAQVMPPPDFDPVIPPDAKEMWEISLNWSVFRQGKWQPPRVGGRKLIMTEFRPQDTLHVRTTSYSGNRLAINIFASTSPEFNERPLRLYRELDFGIFSIWTTTLVDQDPSRTTHDPALRPLHLARFVFKRDVDEVQLSDWNNRWTQLTTNPVYGAAAMDTRELVTRLTGPPVPQDMMYRQQSIVNTPENTSDFYVTGPATTSRRLQEDALLEAAPSPFRALPPSNISGFNSTKPFFYTDRERNFFVRPTREWRVDGSFTTVEPSLSSVAQYRVKYRFDRFYHPFTDFFLDTLATGGLMGFYKRSTQLSPPSTFAFPTYLPDNLVTADYRDDVVDFGYASAYGHYNWELFFHVPWLLANKLAENQRFDEALTYLRHIFNPTDASSDPAPQRYWITKPFHQMAAGDYNAQRIDRLLEAVNTGSAVHEAQVEAWRDDPFDPHLIARLRPVAYQRAIVMAYIELLLDWGDREFRNFTTESLNLASLYYVRALELLGRRPETVPVDRRADAKSFNDVEADLDAFGNLLAEVENLLPPPPGGSPGGGTLPPISIFYFCIPGNDKLLDYWDRVERNLFNLRNCRDIDGIERPLPLFAPPIDPAMLVRAAAAGIDLSTLAGGAAVALPHYRFSFMIKRAYDFAAEVERLGGALLRALEKRDAAELDELRNAHLEELYKLMKDTAKLRIEEQKSYKDVLKEAKELIKIRKKYFDKKKSFFSNFWEGLGFVLKITSFAVKAYAVVGKAVSSGLKLIPEFQVGGSGGGGSPQATGQYGGKQAGGSADKFAESMAAIGGLIDKGADLSFKTGYLVERQGKYQHEYDKAEQEEAEIEKRIETAEIAIAIAEKDYEIQERKIEQARAVGDFLTSRYTNRALYDWMVSTVSSVYFQAYTLAYDMALAAGTCAEREVGLTAGDYIGFGYWDSLRKGLLSGEKLSLDLRRLEAAYIDRNKRRYEITKDVSLALLDAEALLQLRSTGSCEFTLPETLFDMDHPGHYKRRIRSVAVTIPTGADGLTSVNAKLTLLRDEIRMTPSLTGGYSRTSMTDDDRFADNWSATRAIVTSKAVNDAGLHELDLDDDRYLPFEGAGAVGDWRLDLPADTNAFDLDDVTDAILHIRYVADEGGETLATAARETASAVPNRQGATLIRLDQAMPDQWAALSAPPAAGEDQSLTLSYTAERLPYLDRGRTVRVTDIILTAVGAAGDLTAQVTAPGDIVADIPMTADPDFGNRISGDAGGAFAAGADLGDFTIKIRRNTALDFRSLAPGDLAALYAVVVYEAAG